MDKKPHIYMSDGRWWVKGFVTAMTDENNDRWAAAVNWVFQRNGKPDA